ncbi:T9SS type A sorting domain-containing protein [Rhodohalobacter sp. 614A]|uniref:T9SS type A sorting domain-containing protein n=1 Tax=Rhodohalobacter sp. 614A TaxID=2908649 RepID=UPI001F181D42|nr:choice-of-anchor Q domain-containing protein [Rhodohalobacter sp. 614A]
MNELMQISWMRFISKSLLKHLGVMLLILAFPTIVMAQTYTVNSTGDDVDANPGNGTCATSGGVCTLRAAMQEAEAVSGRQDIVFHSSVTGTIHLEGALPDITTGMSIIGPGADVLTLRRSGSGTYRIFHIIQRNITISGLTITNGNVSRGAAIYNKGNLTLLESVITANAGTYGGGIANESSLLIENSIISNNTGGNGAGIYNDNGNLTIRNSAIIDNKANNSGSSNGGGITNRDEAILTIENSTISRNLAEGSGGGISSYLYSTVTIKNSTLTGNSSGYSLGGASLDTDRTTITIYNSVIGNSQEGDECVLERNDGLTISYSLNEDGTCFEGGSNGNLTGDPGLADLADNGGLTPTHALLPDSPLIDAGDPSTSSGGFLTNGNGPIDQAGNSRFTGAAIDIGAYEFDGLSVNLTGDEGFRTFSVPAETRLDDFLEPIWTQGLTGADHSGGDPNVWVWNNDYSGNDINGWELPSNLEETLQPGEGMLVYVFEDDEYETDGSWPKTLSVSGSPEDLPFSFDSNLNTTSNGFTLLGNPGVSSIDWDDMNRSGVANAVYVWDPSAGADGQWISYANGSGDLTGGIIRPFQGFLVQNTNSNPSLEISNYTTNRGEFYGKQKSESEPLAIRFQLEGEGLSSSAWVYFSEDGWMENDPGDALKLQPLTSEYALLSTTSSDGILMDINHLPFQSTSVIELPLNLEVTKNGNFTLNVTKFNLPEGWSAFLTDQHTGTRLNLFQDSKYTFEMKSSFKQINEKAVQKPGVLLKQVKKVKINGGDSRFMLNLTPENVTTGTLPDVFMLSQNYPNPFNPTTLISYQLPVNSEVRLDVYDMLGRNVATLVSGQVSAGRHTVNFDASNLSSGIYLYRLQAGGQIITKKLTVIK